MSNARATQRSVLAFMTDPEAPNVANPIHSGDGARQHGFKAALVGGATIYGWAVAAILDALGADWLGDGWAEVEFRRPVYPGERLDVLIGEEGAFLVRGSADDVRLRGRVGRGDAPWRAQIQRSRRERPEPQADPLPDLIPANVPVNRDLRPWATTLSRDDAETFCRDKQGESLPCFFGEAALVHPAWIASLPIHLLHRSFRYGPAVHTASRIQHLRAAHVDRPLIVTGRCVDAFNRGGHEYIVNDVAVLDADPSAEQPVLAQIRHTAIYRLSQSPGARA